MKVYFFLLLSLFLTPQINFNGSVDGFEVQIDEFPLDVKSNELYTDELADENSRSRKISVLNTKTSHERYINLLRTSIEIDSSTILIENQPGIIIANNNYYAEQIIILNSPNVILRNNTFTGNYTNFASIISIIDSENVLVDQNYFTNITISHIETNNQVFDEIFAVIDIESSSNAQISNNIINGIISTNSNHFLFGIHSVKSSFMTIQSNNITKMESQSAMGMYFGEGIGIYLENSLISGLRGVSQSHVETTGILFNFVSHSFILKNTIFNFSSISSEDDSTNFGITLNEASNITVTDNVIESLNSQAIEPEITGIDAYQIQNVKIMNNTIEDILVYSPDQDEAYATGIYYAFGIEMIVSDNRISSIVSDGTASYAIFADESEFSIIESNIIDFIKALSFTRPTTAAIGLRVTNNMVIRNNRIDNMISEIPESTAESPDFTATSVGLSVDSSNNVSVHQNYLSNLISSSINHKPVDSIGALIGNSYNVSMTNNVFHNLTTLKSVDSFATGIIFWGTQLVSISENEISNVTSISRSEGIFSIENEDSIIDKNRLLYFSAEKIISGISLLRTVNTQVINNLILNFSQPRDLIGFTLEGDNSILIQNNSLNFHEPTEGLVFSFVLSKQLIINQNSASNLSTWYISEESEFFFCELNIHNGTVIQDNCPHKVTEKNDFSNLFVVLLLLLVPIIILFRKQVKNRQ